MIDPITNPTEKNFIIYRSSAGSGKTYTLAREYILLALQHPSYFRSILAVTFTNKATAEMKRRIIENLDELRNGGGKGLRAEIKEALAISDPQLSALAQRSLQAILHDYSHFAVSTIDKFFQRILRAFAREVGIQGGVTLEMDQGKVLEVIIDAMLMEVGDNVRLTGWLTEFAEQKLQEGKSWDIRKDIRSLGQELFKERFKMVGPLLEKVATDEAVIQQVLKGMQELKAIFENTIAGFIASADQTLRQHNLAPADFKSGNNGPIGLFNKFSKKDYEISDKRREAAGEPDHWIAKAAKNRPDLEMALHAGILQAYSGLISYHDRYITQYRTAEQVMRYLYTLGIMADLARKLADYRDEEEVMLISDAPDFLKRIIGDNDTPYIYEKAGSFYRHYLIDEFQDTSGFQWENFRPLVKNSLDQGFRNLVVGDVKQSIYRWRGGDLQLLLDQVQAEIGDAHTDAKTLEHNWRSSANIINFNNKLFELSPELLASLLEEDAAGIIDDMLRQRVLHDMARLRHAYHKAAQKQGNESKLGGMVKLQWLDAGAGEDEEEETTWQELAIKQTLYTVEELQDANYALKDICILVRKADEGRQVAKALLEKKETEQGRYRYDVISPESLYLASSPVVRLLLSAFHHLYKPNDTLSRAQLAYEYHHFLLGKETPVVSDLFLWSGDKQKAAEFDALLPAGFLEHKENLLRVPLMELTERLVGLFGLNNYPREYPYLQGFQDALLEYSKNYRGDVGSFLEWWGETGCRRSIQVPDELDAIRIMTIHKAKGLEFKAVIVPFCCWELDHKLEEVLWCPAPAEKPFDRLPYYPVRYSARLAKTYFAEAYYKERLQIYLDNLNLLYVAFTRAEEALYAFAPLPRFSKTNGSYKKSKVSDLLYCLLMEGSAETFDTTPPPQIDEAAAYVTIGKLSGDSRYEIGKIAPSVKLKNYLSSNWRQRLSIRLQGGTLDPEQREKSLIATRRGTIYHRILSQISHRKDLPHVLSAMLPQEHLPPEDRQAIELQLEKLFALPEMQNWYNGEWEVKTESPVLPTGGDVRRFDRVLIKGSEAILIEFKTGLPAPRHVQQAVAYVDLLGQMGYGRVSGYLVYIDGLTVQQVA